MSCGASWGVWHLGRSCSIVCHVMSPCPPPSLLPLVYPYPVPRTHHWWWSLTVHIQRKRGTCQPHRATKPQSYSSNTLVTLTPIVQYTPARPLSVVVMSCPLRPYLPPRATDTRLSDLACRRLAALGLRYSHRNNKPYTYKRGRRAPPLP